MKDHLGGGLDNLRFSKRTWESNFFPTSGFYTNRLRASEIIGIFREVGFEIIEKRENRWHISPINRKKLCKDFSNISDDDILINGLDIILKKPV